MINKQFVNNFVHVKIIIIGFFMKISLKIKMILCEPLSTQLKSLDQLL